MVRMASAGIPAARSLSMHRRHRIHVAPLCLPRIARARLRGDGDPGAVRHRLDEAFPRRDDKRVGVGWGRLLGAGGARREQQKRQDRQGRK